MRNVSEELVERDMTLLLAERVSTKFTGVRAADALLNDLKAFPHAFVPACVTDRQIKAEVAWCIPHELSQSLGDFSFAFFQAVPRERFREVFSEPNPLHRFPEKMSENVYEAIQRIGSRYHGNAASIWRGVPASVEVVLRFVRL